MVSLNRGIADIMKLSESTASLLMQQWNGWPKSELRKKLFRKILIFLKIKIYNRSIYQAEVFPSWFSKQSFHCHKAQVTNNLIHFHLEFEISIARSIKRLIDNLRSIKHLIDNLPRIIGSVWWGRNAWIWSCLYRICKRTVDCTIRYNIDNSSSCNNSSTRRGRNRRCRRRRSLFSSHRSPVQL